MYQTRNSFDLQQPAADERAQSRLSWLLAANQSEAMRQRFFRSELEEEERLVMRRPVDRRKAFGLFGLLLGTFPPAAIFIKLFGYGITEMHRDSLFVLLMCLAMNVICGLFGGWVGLGLTKLLENLEQGSWLRMLLLSPLMGLAWAIPTGAAGGVIAFIYGAVFGAIFAMPVGLLAFSLFLPLHRLLARGGMIEASHFWPLAYGVVFVITALILGM